MAERFSYGVRTEESAAYVLAWSADATESASVQAWRSWLPQDTLAIPPCAILLSILLLLLQLPSRLKRHTSSSSQLPQDSSSRPLESFDRQRIRIHQLEVIRLLCSVTLLLFSIVTWVHGDSEDSEAWKCTQLSLSLIAVYVYTSSAALASIVLQTHRRAMLKRHVAGVMFVVWVTFAYRDLWPLATYALQPSDIAEGALLWVKISVLTVAAVIIPAILPRERFVSDGDSISGNEDSEQTASLLSRVTFAFLDRVVWKGYKQGHLSADELLPLAEADSASHLVSHAFPELDPLQQKKPRHLFLSLLWLYRTDYAWLSVLLIFRTATRFVSPIGIYQLLRYLENPDSSDMVIRPWVWISWLFFGPVISTMAVQNYTFLVTRVWCQAQGLLTQLIFNHALRSRIKAEVVDSSAPGMSGSRRASPGESKNATGRLYNLAANDVNNLLEGRDFLHILYTPIQIALSMVFLYSILGWSAFVGLATIVGLMPVPGIFASLLQKLQMTKMKKTDARVQEVTEVVTVIRMIKLFAWERRTSERLDAKREDELRYIRKFNILRMFNENLNYFMPFITMITTFAAYSVLMRRELTAAKVFSSITVFDIMREQMMQIFRLAPGMIQAKVSLDRMIEFLRETELLDEFASPTSNCMNNIHEESVGIRSATFVWSIGDQEGASATNHSFKLTILDEVRFETGRLNLIVGPTGSGKTALLLALLGELHYIPHDPQSYVSLPRQRGIAYVPQESWIQNDTIRFNILFGRPYDESRYHQVIHQCALEHDLNLFDHGDMTEVGERGLTLSGGQKARISLARAVYSDADTLLLDDVFAALDVHTSKWIVDKCFKGGFMKGRTVLLVTHNIALVESVASFVVSMGQDGQIVQQGKWSRVLFEDVVLSQESVEETAQVSTVKTASETPRNAADRAKKGEKGKLISPEELSTGRISWKAREFNLYLSSMGGLHVFLFWAMVLLLVLICQVFGGAQTYWLGYWAQQYEGRDESAVSVKFYLGIYIALVGVDFAFHTLGYTAFLFGAIRASQYIHRVLIESVLGSTLRWIERTPSSRIVTRCAQDIQTIDGRLPDILYDLLQTSATMLVKFSAIVFVAPIFSLLGAFTAVFGGWCGQVYVTAQLPIKREQSNARAPILGHLGATLSGLVTIRAYGVQRQFIEESYRRIDRYSRASLTFYTINRWISLRLEALSSLLASCLAAYLVYGNNTNAATTGFALNMAVGFGSMVLWWIRVYNESEVTANSLERVEQYMEIEHEPRPTSQGTPPAYWPASGSLMVDKLSARYSEDGPLVLDNISFAVKPGEHVGIVGRTGSGKSSLTLSLLRLIPTEGHVYFDDLPIDSINVANVRSNITIIPQMPELLSGTLRQNLDPFAEYDDATLNDALRTAGLFSLRNQTGQDRVTLDFQISSGGGNLSVGQRQIIAIARAIIRQSKLLILDEATSAIDYETDTIIQRSLREAVSKDVTLLTIAHRLQTIMDADKILVLDSGHVAEFGSPAELLENKEGLFRTLVHQSGDKETLLAMVAKRSLAST